MKITTQDQHFRCYVIYYTRFTLSGLWKVYCHLFISFLYSSIYTVS